MQLYNKLGSTARVVVQDTLLLDVIDVRMVLYYGVRVTAGRWQSTMCTE